MGLPWDTPDADVKDFFKTCGNVWFLQDMFTKSREVFLLSIMRHFCFLNFICAFVITLGAYGSFPPPPFSNPDGYFQITQLEQPKNPDGRSSGKAYVTFDTPTAAAKAVEVRVCYGVFFS